MGPAPASDNSSGGTGGVGAGLKVARRGAAINGRPSGGMMLVPGLVDNDPLSDEVTAVVQWAPAVIIVSMDEKSLEDSKSLESLGGGR